MTSDLEPQSSTAEDYLTIVLAWCAVGLVILGAL